MTHGRKGLTILKGAKSCEAKRTTADEESRLPRRFEPVKLQVFPPPPVRTVKRIYRAKIRICHLRKNIIPSPRMILCLRRIDLTRCPADEICKRFLILWTLTPSRTDVFILSAPGPFSRKTRWFFGPKGKFYNQNLLNSRLVPNRSILRLWLIVSLHRFQS